MAGDGAGDKGGYKAAAEAASEMQSLGKGVPFLSQPSRPVSAPGLCSGIQNKKGNPEFGGGPAWALQPSPSLPHPFPASGS